MVVVVVKGGDLARIEAKKHLMGGRDEGLVSSVSLKERGEVGSAQCAVRSGRRWRNKRRGWEVDFLVREDRLQERAERAERGGS